RRGTHPDGFVLRQAGGARAVRRRAVGRPAGPSAGRRGHLLRRHLLERGRAAPPRHRRGGGDGNGPHSGGRRGRLGALAVETLGAHQAVRPPQQHQRAPRSGVRRARVDPHPRPGGGHRRMGSDAVADPWPKAVFEQRIRDLLAQRYHDRHPFLVPAARFACDAYVTFVREHSWVEGMASSLTELSAPSIMAVRISAFEEHYPWVDPEGLEYFRTRVTQGSRDAAGALPVVLE